MDRLEHLFTFISLIYGIGVANVLGHLSRLIKQGKSADWFWIHSVWSAYLLIAMASFWWVMQNWATMGRVSYFNFLSMLLVPSCLLMMSDILFPDRVNTAPVDLKHHFFSTRKPFFVLFLALAVADQLDTLQKGRGHLLDLGSLYWGGQLMWYASAVLGMISESERIQGAIAVITIIVFVANILNALQAV